MTGLQDLVGHEAYTQDGEKVGKIKQVICDPAASECVVIRYGLFRDLVVPADVLGMHGDAVTVPFARSFLDAAPRVGKKGELTSEEAARLQHFYHPSAI